MRKMGTTVAPAVAVALIFGAAAVALMARLTPQYEASVRLESAPAPLVREFNAAVDGRAPPSPAADDHLDRRDLPDLALAARDARSLMSRSRANADVKVAFESEPSEFRIVVQAPTPSASAVLANALARAIIVRRNDRVDRRIRDQTASLLMLRSLAASSPAARRRAIEARAELRRLEPLRGLSGGGISIANDADAPREPVSPGLVRSGLAAAFLGMLLGLTPAVAGASWREILVRIARLSIIVITNSEVFRTP